MLSVVFIALTALILIAILIYIFNQLLDANRRELLSKNISHDGVTKKYEDVDIHKTYFGPIFSISLAISLAVILTAFEWKTYEEPKVASLGTLQDVPEEVIEIPPTEQKPPPPPKIVAPEIIEVPDEEDIKQD